MIEEGKTVPMFELSDADGNIVKTKDFKGKKFVVYFYPRDFTPGSGSNNIIINSQLVQDTLKFTGSADYIGINVNPIYDMFNANSINSTISSIKHSCFL